MTHEEIANKIVEDVSDMIHISENERRIVTAHIRYQIPSYIRSLKVVDKETLIAELTKRAREKEVILKQNGHTNVPILFEEVEIVKLINE